MILLLELELVITFHLLSLESFPQMCYVFHPGLALRFVSSLGQGTNESAACWQFRNFFHYCLFLL